MYVAKNKGPGDDVSTYVMPAYSACVPDELRRSLLAGSVSMPGVEGLSLIQDVASGFEQVQTPEAMRCVVSVTRRMAPRLAAVLHQRSVDREFIDRQTLQRFTEPVTVPVSAIDYPSIIGLRDGRGRMVVGPEPDASLPPLSVTVPDFLKGDQVTLFGPPDTPRMAINAMNALHRRASDEAPVLTELVESSGLVPRWGADDEDSQTPMVGLLMRSGENLRGCFEGSLSFETSKKRYELAQDGLSLPIKRIPGLALPDAAHLLDGHPIPLHIFDLVTHLWHLRHVGERAMVFYVPKLENEEEAAYLSELLETAVAVVAEADPAWTPVVPRVLCVFENPRAIFRIREMAAALGPHFLGGSLGWHDYLAAAARLFRHDPGYRIPVKADPDIVIRHIRESHMVLAETMRELGGLAIGGMYGVLPLPGDPRSWSVSMVGYIRDVVTQLRRGLTGFWVAHPDFVRPGIALVEAWRRLERDPEDPSLEALVRVLVDDPDELARVLDFLASDDIDGLAPGAPGYERSLLAANIEVSEVIANDDPEEVRYNVFVALQYLAGWLSGVGCVALPSHLKTAGGDDVMVRIMDDLATTERSRWELWAEVQHGRVARADFERILAEELDFIKSGGPQQDRRVEVAWSGDAARWYPLAGRLLHQLVTADPPVEAVPELLLPFTFDVIRSAADPWAAAVELCPGKYSCAPGKYSGAD